MAEFEIRITQFDLVVGDNKHFTKRQFETISLMIKGFTSYKEIASQIKISSTTVKNVICGINPNGSRCAKGVYGVVKDKFGTRPSSMAHCIWLLLENDVIHLLELDQKLNDNIGNGL